MKSLRPILFALVAVLAVSCQGLLHSKRLSPEDAEYQSNELLQKGLAFGFGSDSMLYYVHEAQKVIKGYDNKKLEILLYSIEPTIWLDRDLENYAIVSVPYRDICLKYGELKRYFTSYTALVNMNLKRGNVVDAIKVCTSLHQDAVDLEYKPGLVMSYRMFGKIYASRDDKESSKKYFHKAISYCTDERKELSNLYSALASLFPEQSDSAVVYYQEALKNSVMLTDSLENMGALACSYILRNDKEELNRLNAYLDADNLPSSVTSTGWYKKLKVFEYAESGQWKDAIAAVDSIGYSEMKLRLYYFVAMHKKDSLAAFKALRTYDSYKDSIRRQMTSVDLLHVESQLNEDELELYKAKEESKLRGILLIVLMMVVLLIAIFAFIYIKASRDAVLKQAKLSDDLRRANEAKTHMVQNVSHEIRTPLNAILGFSQILAMPSDFVTDDERTTYNNYIMNNYDLLSMLIDDILTISDIEHKNYVMAIGDASVDTICENSIQCAMSRCPSGVDMRWTSDFGKPFHFQSDAKRIQQVMVNFLTNSCKHTQRGEIELKAAPIEKDGAQYVEFSVRDTGTGVPPEMAKVIFDRFSKLDRYVQGAGLGLSISKMIADKLHADIYLDTEYKSGARFVFVVPVEPVVETQDV